MIPVREYRAIEFDFLCGRLYPGIMSKNRFVGISYEGRWLTATEHKEGPNLVFVVI
jgi:hypothetical protein